MCIANRAHGIDLEVLIASHLRNSFDWSPVSEGRLCIVEPLITSVLDLVTIDVGYTLGDL